MPADYSDSTVIIPTCNEARNIGGVVGEVARAYPSVSILVVDDCSTDGTIGIVKKLAQKNKKIKLIVRKNKQKGLTASIIDGIENAKTKYVVVMDGDGQHPPEKIRELVDALRAGKEVAVAYRTSVPGWALHRQIISIGAALLGRIFLFAQGAPSCRDILSGFFGINTELAKKTIGKNGCRFVGGGYKFLYDFLKCLPRSAKIGEVGYVFGLRERGSSKIGFRQYASFLKSLLT